MNKKIFLLMVMVTLLSNCLIAQSTTKKKERKGEFYFSWGYNKEWYTLSELRVSQAGLGNDYVLKGLHANDHPGWNEGLFSKALSIPQYNYRLGYFFNKKKGLGFEINFDHTKYILSDGDLHMVGKYNNRNVDTTIGFNYPNSFYYLNNGANFLLFNIVKRSNIYKSKNEKVKLDFLGKAGIGPLVPHVENRFFGGAKNDPHFQIGGWNIGVEGCIRATFFNSFFLEYTNKLDYARYSGLKIYSGTAHQAFGTYEMILNLGFTIPSGKKVE